MLNDINLADIRTFVLIAELGNFTKAAEALSVSRSHVSKQVSALEAQLGVTLITRTTRTLRLTAAGEALYQRCTDSLHGIEQALLEAIDNVEEVRGLIRVNSVGGYIGEQIIARYVADFMALYPDISIDLDFSSHRVDLIQDEFDIAFRMGDLEDSGFIAKHLMVIETGTLASPDYIASAPALEHPRQLVEHRCLLGSVKRWRFFEAVQPENQYEITLTAHLSSKNGVALMQGALRGNGIIRVPLMYCQDELERGALVPVLADWKVASVNFSALYHRDKYQPLRLRTFIDYIKQRFDAEFG